MRNDLLKNIYWLMLLLIIPFVSEAQTKTEQWRLIWDKNQEDDIANYRVFRGESPAPVTKVATIPFTDNVFTDTSIEPGKRYYYRLQAVDNDSLVSDYSDQVSAAIPALESIPYQVFNQGANIGLDLDDYVNDWDGNDSEITWTFGNTNHLDFELDADRNLTISSTDTSWAGDVLFTATDEDEFFNTITVSFIVNGLPVCTGIPDQLQQQGSPFDPILLNDYVHDPDQQDSLLAWETAGTGELQVVLNAQNELQVSHPDNFTDMQVEEQWYGVETLQVKATDPFGANDSLWVKFEVNARPRIQSIPVPTTQALQPYRYDLIVEDPDSLQEPTIEWLDYPDFLQLASVTSLYGTPEIADTGNYPIRVKVLDSRGGENLQEFTLAVQFAPGTPLIDLINPQTIAEGETFTSIPLNDFISNANEQDSVFWSANGQVELIVGIDNSGKATIGIPDIDWFGQEQILFKATNEHGLSAQQSVLFKVDPVNDAPVIGSLTGQKIYQNDQFDILDLNNFASDVDNLPATLDWSITGNSNLDIVPVGINRFQIIPNVDNWYGIESLVIKVSDSQGLSDQVTITYEIGKSIYSPFSTRFINSGTIVEITWETELESIGTIQFGIDDLDQESDSEPRAVTAHSIILSGLESNEVYQLRALSEDNNGYKHISNIQSFTTGLAGEISVFPNPYRAGAYPENDVIHFANLPEGTTISIFNLLGEPIFSKQDQSNLFRWNVKNKQEKDVQSGLYIYLLKDSNNKKIESGKIVIIR